MNRFLRPNSGDDAFNGAMCLLAGVYGIYFFLVHGAGNVPGSLTWWTSIIRLALSVLMILSAPGFWWRKRWGAVAGLFVFGTFAVLALLRVWLQGPRVSNLIAFVGLTAVFAYLWHTRGDYSPGFLPSDDKSDDSDDDDSAPFSIVALLPGSPDVSIYDIAAAIEAAWGVKPKLHDSEEEGNTEENDAPSIPMLIGAAPIYTLFCAERGAYLFHVHDVRYIDEEHQDSAISGLGHDLAAAIRLHQSWIAVDVMGLGPETSDEDRRSAYRNIARLMAELLPDDALALFLPSEGRLYRVVPETRDLLRAEDPVAKLLDEGPVPVFSIAADDPEILAAVEEARSRWPEFVAAFESRGTEDLFGVKAPLGTGDDIEHIWLSVEALEGDRIYGRLDNHPYGQTGYRMGDRVNTEVSRLSDWLIVRSATSEATPSRLGGFSVEVIQKRMQQRSENPDAT